VRIAITGATGFLGSWVTLKAIEAGHEVIALGRNPEKGRRLTELGATFMEADLQDAAALTQAFHCADAVIHCAALSSPWGARSAFWDANVEGTKAVASAALGRGVNRLVVVSSASVYASTQDRLGWKETDALPPPINAYAESKQRMEGLLPQWFPQRHTVVLRPRAIFGPGDTALWPRLKKVGARGRLPLFRGGEPLMDMLYVEDAARACLAAITGKAGTYNLTQGEPRPVEAVFRRVFEHQGIPVSFVPMPFVAPFLWAARAVERLHRLRRLPGEPALTAYALSALAYSQTLDISAAQAGLGWTPSRSINGSLAQTFHAPPHVLERGIFA